MSDEPLDMMDMEDRLIFGDKVKVWDGFAPQIESRGWILLDKGAHCCEGRYLVVYEKGHLEPTYESIEIKAYWWDFAEKIK